MKEDKFMIRHDTIISGSDTIKHLCDSCKDYHWCLTDSIEINNKCSEYEPCKDKITSIRANGRIKDESQQGS